MSREMCEGEDCFRSVAIDEFTERLPNGDIHPLAKLCYDCGTLVNATKRLSRFRKNQSRKRRTPLLDKQQ